MHVAILIVSNVRYYLISILPTVIDCGPLENPENGTVTIDSGVDAVIVTGHHAVATYTCDLGYRLDSGSSTRTCGTSGTWSGTMAVCVCEYNCEWSLAL